VLKNVVAFPYKAELAYFE